MIGPVYTTKINLASSNSQIVVSGINSSTVRVTAKSFLSGPPGPNRVTDLIVAGSNIFISGLGTPASPYVINSTAIGGVGGVTSVNTRTGTVVGLAEDNAVVHLAGAETVTGAKTFSAAATFRSTIFFGNGYGGVGSSGYISGGDNGINIDAHNSNGRIMFTVNGLEHSRFDQIGRLGLGINVPTSKLHLSDTTPLDTARVNQSLIIENSGFGDDDIDLIRYSDTWWSKHRVYFKHARGTKAIPTSVLDGDILGFIAFGGYNATAATPGFQTGISIDAYVDGVLSPTGVAGRYRIHAHNNTGVMTAALEFSGANGTVKATGVLEAFNGLKITNSSTLGYVWTAKDAFGNGSWQAAPAGGSAITTSDEGVSLTPATTSFNFVGTGVTATNTAGAVTVTIPGSAGGVTNLTNTLTATNNTINSDTGTDAIIPATDAANAGLFLPAEKTKLTGIATGATANSSDAALIARANHTGTQLAATVSDFSTAADARITTANSSVATLTNKRITDRVTTPAFATATYTIAGDTTDVAKITTAPTANFTIAAPTGTPTDEQKLELVILSGATGFTATWNAIFMSSSDAILPTTALTANKRTRFGFVYDSVLVKWVLIAKIEY